jgi:DNA-directed RNA polymerase specialized sigma24 family protein
VVEDVKLAVLGSIKPYRKKKGAFHSWLGTITHCKIMDVLRIRIPYDGNTCRSTMTTSSSGLWDNPMRAAKPPSAATWKDKTNLRKRSRAT